MHNLKVENYALFGGLAEDLSPGYSLSALRDCSEEVRECKQTGQGVPGDREPGMAFWTYENPFWPMPFCDLSLAPVLALEQVSVISDVKRTEEHRDREKAVIKQSPSSSSRDKHNNIP